MSEFRTNFSRWVLFRMILLTVFVAAAVIMNLGFLKEVYFGNQPTPVGLIINGGILLLFVLGLIKIIAALLRYTREEATLARFIKRIDMSDPVKGLGKRTIIVRRHHTIQLLNKRRAPINQSALAATLLADESTRISFARFISNILILVGVFGTIVSLSMALIGASNMLDGAQDIANMGLVVHGMSTALSTTMTAIACYLFLGYFFLKLTDAQTNLVSAIEQVTSMYLLPKHISDNNTLLLEVGKLVNGLRVAAEGMNSTQAGFAFAAERLQQVVEELDLRVSNVSTDIRDVKSLLQEGFRLPERDSA